jgi:uncharacterized protein YjbI with pentapeptide repeats
VPAFDPDSDDTTLQDYWRKDPVGTSFRSDDQLLAAKELEKDPFDRLWHIAHIPVAWDDGSPTWKADPTHENWERLWELLRSRIFAFQRRQLVLAATDDSEQEKTQFGGVVFGKFPDDWEWHDPFDTLRIKFATCAFLDEVDFSHVESHTGLDLRYSLFLRRAAFDHILTKGNLDFSNSMFAEQLSLCDAKIFGSMTVRRIHCFGEAAILNNIIGGATEITESVFYGANGFEGTSFVGDVTVSFCRFLGLVSAAQTKFMHKASIVQCMFLSEDVSFTGRCRGDFSFIDCTVKDCTFAFLHLCKDAYFSATRFHQNAGFQNVDFHGKVSFRNAVFESDATFQDVRFRGPIEFHNTVFAGVADLSRCTFPEEARLFHSGFRGAEFRRVADFTNPEFRAWGAFAGAKFHQLVLFSPEVLRNDASIEGAFEDIERIAEGVRNAGTGASGDVNEPDHLLGDLEAAFQTLKVAMAAQQSRLEEQRFYRFELVARRMQAGTPGFEKVFSILYSVTSAYGTSLIRPAVWLLALTFAFASVYWAMTQTLRDLAMVFWPFPLGKIDPDMINALTFSFRNVFQPFSAWVVPAGNSTVEDWTRAFLNNGGPLHHLAARLLASLQSFVSPILLFLSALAVKRRFQIT